MPTFINSAMQLNLVVCVSPAAAGSSTGGDCLPCNVAPVVVRGATREINAFRDVYWKLETKSKE